MEALDAGYADADVRRLDHGDVVGAVADREEDRFEVSLYELDYEGFLEGGDAARSVSSVRPVR